MLDSERTTATPPARFRWRAELGVASVVALAVVLIVLWEPIVFVRERTLGAWDWLAQSSPLTHVEPDAPIENPAMGDPERQFVPWALLARAELAAGRAPLWNASNGTGVPLLANYQSALLSPFTLPFYVLPLKLALLASAAAKLAVATIGMFLLLRSLGRSRAAAALGAMAYALSGFHMLCLLHPHVGVLALLPLCLFAVDRVARTFASEPHRVPIGWLPLLALALGLAALAGHPESLLFTGYFVAAFSAYHLGRLLWLSRRDPPRVRRVLVLASGFVAAGVLGAMLAAVQWLPFVEYLRASASLAAGGRDVEPLSASYVLLQFFPNLAGTMLGGRWIPRGLVPGYHECNAFYVGGTITIAALGALPFARREPDVVFFLALGCAVLLYAFDAPALSTVLGPLFGSHYVPAPRASSLWVVSACALAAFTVDKLRASGGRRAWLVIGAGALALVAGQFGARAFWADLATRNAEAFEPLAAYLRENVLAMTIAIAVGLAALALLTASAKPVARALAFAALFAVVAAHNVLGFGGYVPTVDDRFVLPRTAAIERIARAVAGERTVFLSWAGLQTNANLFYGVPMVTSYDALEIRELDDLRAELFGYSGYFALALQASRRALDLFGVRYVATRGEWIPIDTEHSHRGLPEADTRWYVAGELGLPRKPHFLELDRDRPSSRQTLDAARDGLDGLVVHFLEDPATLDARATLELLDQDSNVSLARREVRLRELRRIPGGRLEFVLDVPPVADSHARKLALEIRVDDAPPDAAVKLFRVRESEAAQADNESDDERGGKRARGRVVLDISYGRSDFERVAEVGEFLLYRYTAGRGRAWIVPNAIGVDSAEAARERVLADFDPRNEVVVESAVPTPRAAGRSELGVLRETPQSSSYRARCDVPAYLVLAQAWFPGWTARVDGKEVPLLRANYAFCAVALPAGESAVELRYEPSSFRIAWIVSLIGCAGLVLACAAARAKR